MKKGDQLAEYREHMRELHATFIKKTHYHRQKAFLEPKDLYWLMHEFFVIFLQKDQHFTEEELIAHVKHFTHDFLTIHPKTVNEWETLLYKLSEVQYAGVETEQPVLHALLEEFDRLVDQTVGKAYAPPDTFTKELQQAQLYLKHDQIEKAETIYKQLVEAYTALSEAQKHEYHQQLAHLYDSIAAFRSELPVAHR
jgi:hypothetical protein